MIMKNKEDIVGSKQPLSIRIAPQHIELAKQIADRKAISYQSLMRMWIVEGIEREMELLKQRKAAYKSSSKATIAKARKKGGGID